MVNAYFLDTSALVKRYIPETGTDWILSITDPATGKDLAIAQITWVEVLSALSRRQRQGSISADRFDLTLQDFRVDFENLYQVIEVDRSLIEIAGQLVIQYPLRAYDAVQLASALRVQSLLASLPDIELVFVTADDRLINVAQTEGLVTDNPNNYP
ncbi:type II toxin-antitoxin system VapC family toxin [Argonema galeatum]|uniref:type II toxin-antitoxin system VapC family toxin n=1 Tax=Argonema galeatum TaxID=2942762 RepID=UPI0020113D5B|nr:type II toxin-antitoxin system VapC family toxin [Argonema galeatum A003/A1]